MKHDKLKKILFGTAASLGTAMFIPIQQEAHAQTAAQTLLEEVVVTARRREETLEDAPLSVVAISGEAMRVQGIYNTQQIGDFAANVNLQVEDRSNISQIHIRGIGGGFANPIQVFGAGMYIDGHYMAGSLGNYMSAVDVERVEVLRGPQGTLFGKNVTGGAVNIVTVKPQPEFESSITLRAGDYGQQDVRGMVNIPISDNVYGRFTFTDEQNDGFWRNRIQNSRVDWNDAQSFRGALRFERGDNWTIDVSYLHFEADGGNTGLRCEARPSQGLLDALQNQHPDVLALTPAEQAAIAAVHPAQDVSNLTAYADGYGAWGGATTYYNDPATGVPLATPINANIGGRVELLGPGATVQALEACQDDMAAGDFVNSADGPHNSILESDNFFVSAIWDSGGPVGSLDNLEVRTNITNRKSEYTWQVDRDNTLLPIDHLGHTGFAPGFVQDSTGFEMIFDATVSDRLSFLAGVWFFDDEANTGSSDCWPLYKSQVEQQLLDDITADPLGDPLALDGTETSTFDVYCGAASGGSGLQFQWMPPSQRPGGYGQTLWAGAPATVANGGFGDFPQGAFQQVNTSTESKAVFAHMNYAINDDWSLEVGARWTEDHRIFNIVEFAATNTCEYNFADHCLPNPSMNYGSFYENGFFGEGDATFDEITPMVSLTRNLAPGDTLDSGIIYGLISEGFLTGSFNDELNTVRSPQLEQLRAYGPEYVTNYEVGFKGTFAGGRVRLNADIFWMDYTDKQEAVNLNNPDGLYGPDPTVEITQNAGVVDIYGLELELRASPWDGGFVTFDLGLLDNEYSVFNTVNPENTDEILDLTDLRVFDRQPDWSYNAQVGHTFSLNNGGAITATLGVYAQGGYEWQPNTLLTEKTPCYQDDWKRFRARVTYEPPGGNWEASLFGDNITDERYMTYCEGAPSGSIRAGALIAAYGRPDWWGLEFVARFGEN